MIEWKLESILKLEIYDHLKLIQNLKSRLDNAKLKKANHI